MNIWARICRIAQQVAKHRMRVFDFDDTLVSSESSVVVEHGNGEMTHLDSASFAYFRTTGGDKIDFGDFNNVTRPRLIKKNMDLFRQAADDKEAKTVILTARPKGSASAVQKFMKHLGFANIEVVALQSSDPMDKARWIQENSEGVDDIEFTDDSSRNVAAVDTLKGKVKGKVKTNNPAHPKEDDYEGVEIMEVFISDEPTKAIVEAPAKKKEPKPTGEAEKQEEKPSGPSEWWREQTPEFHRQYCKIHPESKYCGA